MKIALIAHGTMPIPPTDWGAVERIVWNYKVYLERLGHTVDIANTRAIHNVIYQLNLLRYDFVHCHCELFLLECLAHLECPFAVTSHNWLLQKLDLTDTNMNQGIRYFFEDSLLAPANIVLSERIRDTYIQHGYKRHLYVLRNAVETESFRISPHGNGKAVCVGAITARKRQGWLAAIAKGRFAIDFIGPRDADSNSRFEEHETAKYVGTWSRTTLYERLTEYSCLVLLSKHEAAPLVVLEALAAGVSLVIADACAANLTSEAFITVLPDDERRPDVIAHAIQSAIDRNAEYRQAIRAYARRRFDYSVVAQEYLQIIEQVRDRHSRCGRSTSLLAQVVSPASPAPPRTSL